MKTFSIQTLGCKVNQYESEQVATLLRRRGLLQVSQDEPADLRVVNTCSVTAEADAKSRQIVGRSIRLPVQNNGSSRSTGGKLIVLGCWSTSHPDQARKLGGEEACVLTHSDPVADQLARYLDRWQESVTTSIERQTIGACSLPLLESNHSNHVRAFLKIQDGCDAHCTYCIIPRLRPNLWSKPIEDAVLEAQRLVDAGHREIVLTGIFMGAFGQPTALRRRQTEKSALTKLIDALCTRVNGLTRLRLSSLEPGDLDDELLHCLTSHTQVVPHFHLPLQSGSAEILRKMNRQYSRDDFLEMVDRVRSAFDRPALTTDIIAGFPNESDDDFTETLDIVDRAGFIHVHAFPYSSRDQTAAARWKDQHIPREVSRARIQTLEARAAFHSTQFRGTFIGETVEVLVERSKQENPATRHGRCERYFDVTFDASREIATGDSLRIRVDRVEDDGTFGTVNR